MIFGDIHNSAQLTELISSIGFLPLLDSGIPGFSAEEMKTICPHASDKQILKMLK